MPNLHAIATLLLAGLLLACAAASPAAEPDPNKKAPADGNQLRVYVGTYTRKAGKGTRKASKGIYLVHLDTATGRLDEPTLAAEVTNPSFLAIHPSRRFVYAVGEMGSVAGKKGGAVSALAVDRQTGKLTLINQQSSGGAGPCHLVVDTAGRNVLVANYGGGSVASLPIREDGRLGQATSFIQHEGSSVDPRRQKGPHAHGIYLDPAGRFAFVPDLGLDKVVIHRFDATLGSLAPNDPPFATVTPGAGPRHFAFHPSARYAYVINEMGSTVTAFGYDARRGDLKSFQTVSTLPEGFAGNNTTAEIFVHPSGKFLYGSNRGHDSIAIFAVDAATGKLASVGHESTRGKNPRGFNLDPTGTWLVAGNQDTDNVVVFRVDARTGKLRPTGQSVTVGTPVCIEFTRP